jgi:hypothetical protein
MDKVQRLMFLDKPNDKAECKDQSLEIEMKKSYIVPSSVVCSANMVTMTNTWSMDKGDDGGGGSGGQDDDWAKGVVDVWEEDGEVLNETETVNDIEAE